MKVPEATISWHAIAPRTGVEPGLVQDGKVVVFSQWRRMLELAAWSVSDLLAGAGRRALFFTGQEGPRRRTQNLVDFHDDPRASVLFLTDAGGVGLNLQKAASACINLELPWNPAVLEQRIGRIHRLGQSRPIDVYNLVGRSCIEERIAGLVSDKRALFKGLFEGTSDDLRFDRQRSLLNLIEGVAEPAVPGTPAAPAEEEGIDDPPEVAALEEPGPDGPAEVRVSAASDGILSGTSPRSRGPSIEAVGGDVGHLFAALTVERSADGGIRIDAPPQAARALMSLFEGMARLMATAAEPTVPSAPGNGSREVAPRA